MTKPLLLLIVLVLLTACPAWAVLTIDAVMTPATGTTSTSSSMTIAADANLVVVFAHARDGAGAPGVTSAVTVGGVSATVIPGCDATGGAARTSAWALVTPPTGVVTVAVTNEPVSIDQSVTGAISFKNAAGTFNTCTTFSSGGTTAVDVNSVASAVGDIVVMALTTNAAPTCAPDATVPVSTERYDAANGGNAKGCGYTEDGAAATTDMRADLGSSVNVSAVAVAVQPAIIGGGATAGNLMLLGVGP